MSKTRKPNQDSELANWSWSPCTGWVKTAWSRYFWPLGLVLAALDQKSASAMVRELSLKPCNNLTWVHLCKMFFFYFLSLYYNKELVVTNLHPSVICITIETCFLVKNRLPLNNDSCFKQPEVLWYSGWMDRPSTLRSSCID